MAYLWQGQTYDTRDQFLAAAREWARSVNYTTLDPAEWLKSPESYGISGPTDAPTGAPRESITTLEGALQKYNQSNFDVSSTAKAIRELGQPLGLTDRQLAAAIPVFGEQHKAQYNSGYTEGSNYEAIAVNAVKDALNASGRNGQEFYDMSANAIAQGANSAQGRWAETQKDTSFGSTGLGKLVAMVGQTLAAVYGGPVGAAAFSYANSGGDIGNALTSGVLTYAGGQLTGTGAGAEGGSWYSPMRDIGSDFKFLESFGGGKELAEYGAGPPLSGTESMTQAEKLALVRGSGDGIEAIINMDAIGGPQALGFPSADAALQSLVPQFAQAGVTAAQLGMAAQAAQKGFGVKEALQMAGVAAPVIGALISSGAIKDATGAQQQATDQAIAQINSGATGATQGINDAQLAGVGLQNDALKAGLDQLQSQYDTGVAQQNESLGATLADLNRRYESGVTEQRGALASTLAGLTDKYNSGVTEQRGALAQGMSDLAPYREAGAGAINRLGDLMGTSGRPDAPNYGDLTKKFTLADFWNDPVTQASYQQGLDQGTKALQNTARSNGSLNSGATLKALTRFGTDYTGDQAAASQGRFVGDQNNTYNRLSGIASTGQNAVNSGNTLGFNTAQNIAGQGNAFANNAGAFQSNTASNIANQGNATANAAGGFRAGTANNIANSGNLFATNAAQMRTGTANNIANSGNVAATNAANINIGANNSIANLLSGMGNARGAASIAQGNNIAGAGNTIANWFNSQNTLDKILGARK